MENLDNLRPQDQRPFKLASGEDGIIIRIDGDGNCLFRAIVTACKYLNIQIPYNISDHESLRSKVVEELTKPEYADLINETIRDEKGIPVAAITDSNRKNYLSNMAKVNTWGGKPELYAIANILQTRIIIHQDDQVIKISHGADYDTWLELIELNYESVNADLNKASSTNNHYNLIIPVALGEKILSEYFTNKILSFKTGIQKCPHPDSEDAMKHFKGFFNAFHNFCNTIQENEPDLKLQDKCIYHLEMLWGYLLHKFMSSSIWPYDDNGYNEKIDKKYWQSGGIDTKRLKVLIKEAIQKNELPLFFKTYPYVKDLIKIDEYLNSDQTDVALRELFHEKINSYLAILPKYDGIQPLITLREHVKLMLSRSDFDMSFHNKYMKSSEASLRERKLKSELDLIFLASFIEKNITYDLHDLPGFNKLKWDAFNGLAKAICKDKNIISAARTIALAEALEKYLADLILFQLGHILEDAIAPVDVSDIMLLKIEENIAPAFQIIEDYLDILDQVVEDNETSRLAILRSITAIGEAFRSINLLIPEAHREDFKLIADLRDHIIHSSTFDAWHYINNLISNPNNKILLTNCLLELKKSSRFFEALKNWLKTNKNPLDIPVIPNWQNLTALNEEFARARQKDDRNEQIPVAQRLALLASLPTVDSILNPNIAQIRSFIFDGMSLSRNEFKECCLTLNSNNSQKFHERIIEFKKIKALKKAITEDKVDFNKINLNIAKVHKEQLKIIKEQNDTAALELLLDEHEKTIALTPDAINKFVDSISIIDIKPYKILLKKFVEQGVGDIKREEFDRAVKIVFWSDENYQKLWKMSYKMLVQTHINSLKRYQIILLDHTMQNIERLKLQIDGIFDGKHVNVRKNLVSAIASEMLFGFCLEEFKKIKKFLNSMYDYQDQTLYFFAPNHPLENVEKLLKIVISMRNDIFHFERVYKESLHIQQIRPIWFSFIQDFTHGTFFPEAIVISKNGVSREPRISNPTMQELQKLRNVIAKDLPRDENTLNMYEAKIKSNVLKVRIASDANEAMRAIIPFSQMARQYSLIRNKDMNLAIFLGIFRHFEVQYIEPSVILTLLVAAKDQRIVKAEEVKNLVYSESQMFFAQSVKDNLEKQIKPIDRNLLNRQLFNAAFHGILEEVKSLILLGADINSQHTDERTQSNTEVYLYRGKTPLFIAAEMGHHDVVQFLLANGANPKIRDAGFWCPYDVALVMEHQYGRKECSPCVLTLQGIS